MGRTVGLADYKSYTWAERIAGTKFFAGGDSDTTAFEPVADATAAGLADTTTSGTVLGEASME